MIDVKPTNVKLQLRARKILCEICGGHCPGSDEELDEVLQVCGRSVKLAAVKITLGVSIEEANFRLVQADGVLANLLKAPDGIKSVETGTNDDPQYVLCVDGGGSKCRAVVLGRDRVAGTGEAGPCNPYVVREHGSTESTNRKTEATLV